MSLDEPSLRRQLLTPERVRALSTPNPRRVIKDTALCWLVIVGCFMLVAAHPTWWSAALAFVIIGNRSYSLFIIAHDGLHRRLFASTQANDRFNDWFILGSFGAITRIHNRNHLSHHQNLALPHDPDRYKYSCLTKNSKLGLLSYLAGGLVVQSIFNVLFRKRDATREGNTVARPSATARDLSILVGWQALLWGLGTYFIGWWAVPLLWYAPFFAFALLADNLRTFCEHSHTEDDQSADQHRLITYHANWLERLMFAPMNMNYHAVHHLWPSIPYANLPIADEEIRNHPAASVLEWRTSYLGFIRKYWRAVPINGCAKRITS